MKEDHKEKMMIGLDIMFASISLAALALFNYSIRYHVSDVMDWVSNLDWYWYALVFVITAIHPMMHLMKYLKKNKKLMSFFN